jgi:hypothetical protein
LKEEKGREAVILLFVHMKFSSPEEGEPEDYSIICFHYDSVASLRSTTIL